MFGALLGMCVGKHPGTIQSLPYISSPGGGSLSLLADGTWSGTGAGAGLWVIPAVYASRWEVYAEILSGAVASGTTGSWIDISTARTWTVTNGGTVFAQIRFHFRDKNTLVTWATRDVTLDGSV